MKPILISILTVFLFTSAYSQSITSFLLQNVNHLRDSLTLELLVSEEVLDKAADDQAYYLLFNDKLTHFQKTFRKETPYERVLFYGGNRTYVSENIAQSNTLKELSKRQNKKIADDLFKIWFNSPGHYANMVSSEVSNFGFGIRITKSGKVFAVQVFSSDEVELPKVFNNNIFSWGVRPSEITCKDDEQQYETMFFANHIEEHGSEIYMAFHDLVFFKHVISNENDGMAIDVVLREQLPCDKENQFHISTIFDGEMQEPIYRNDLFKNNISENTKKILVKIGEVPKYLRNQQWDANIIVINDNKLCDYSIPVYIPSAVYPLLDLKIFKEYNDGSINYKQNDLLRITDSLEIIIPFKRNRGTSNFAELKGNKKIINYAKEVEVDCFTSVEGPYWLNLQLLQKRELEILSLLRSRYGYYKKIKFNSRENWSLMNRQIEENDLIFLKNASKEQVKYRIKKNLSPLLDSLLYEQRKTSIKIKVDTLLAPNSYEDFMMLKKHKDLSFDKINWNKILRETYIEQGYLVQTALVDSLKNNLVTKTNLLGVSSKILYDLDSSIISNLQDKIDFNNGKQAFNFANFITHYWYDVYHYNAFNRRVVKTISPNQLLAHINKIKHKEIDSVNMARLKVNILLAGIHYYNANNQWKLTNAYFDQIANLVQKGGFTEYEAIQLALFCNYFHKFDQCVEILDVFVAADSLKEKGTFILARTATLIRSSLDESVYYSYMNRAKRFNKKRYCKWLNDEFQIQRDEKLKQEFCRECN